MHSDPEPSAAPEPQLRRDPLTGDWVVVAASRQSRPNRPSDSCPFCVGGLEAPEPYDVRAFSNRWPALAAGEALSLAGLDERLLASEVPARGACEVLLYTSQHDATLHSLGADGVRRVVDMWAERTQAMLDHPEVNYVLVFENRGELVGATIEHPHGQAYGFPDVPPVVRREMELAERAGACTVCALAKSERAHGARVVADSDTWACWSPAASAWPLGLVLAPVDHVADLASLDARQRDGLAAMLVDVLARMDRLYDDALPYMMWIHYGLHVHVHLVSPLRAKDTQRFIAAGEVGSGVYFNPVAPEQAAAALRNA